MSGQSEKKSKKKATSSNKTNFIIILVATSIFVIVHLFKYFIKGQNEVLSKKEIIRFIILSILNYCCYKLLDFFRGSYWDNYIFDFLGLNCFIEIGVNFSHIFWYFYLIYPAYFLYSASSSCFKYVSNIGKDDGSMQNDFTTPEKGGKEKYKDKGHQSKQDKNKQKVKYVKH